MAVEFYPPTGFYFQLQFAGVKTTMDNAFQEVSGLSVEWDVEEVREGGQNLYKHKFPKVAQYSNLVLKRGFVSSNSALATWVATTFAEGLAKPIQPRDVQLSLLNGKDVALAVWSFQEAWPVKWSMSSFNSQENALAIETLEFAYAFFQRV